MSGDFSPEQKRYLEGFTSGLQIARAGRGLAGGISCCKPPARAAHTLDRGHSPHLGSLGVHTSEPSSMSA